ncbi:hypothetical protein [Streptomyces hawaiiensis]|uniref:hypothetical protein n=1 Tax=Streptomyces hawaiiensis TaxID=67305 RepID=UPI003661F1C8
MAAVLATKHVNVPRGALESVAPFIVRPKDSLTSAENEPDRIPRLRPDKIRRIQTDAGTMYVAVVQMHGVGGVVWEHNERISSTWSSVADPSGGWGSSRSLSRVQPWTRLTEEGEERTLAALENTAPNREFLIGNVDQAVNALSKPDGHRSYDLLEDLVLNGQMEPCMYVPQHIRLDEDPAEQADGRPRYPAEYWGWMAVRGNNRTKYRQQLLGITSAEVLTGVPFKKLGRETKDISVNPNYWLEQYSRLLNGALAEKGEGPDEPGTGGQAGAKDASKEPAENSGAELAERARRARKVAVVEAHLVIGSPTPQRLFRIVQSSNRRDHVHPPLEFGPNDRGRALGRGVLGLYTAHGALDDRTADVLAGVAPIEDLPGVPAEASIATLRDIRSMRLLAELFPTEEYKRQLIRAALSEPAPSQLQSRDINRRVRAWSALTSESFPEPWNPRVAEVLPRASGKTGITLSGRPLTELLAAADNDDDAFEELLAYRAPHWLASFDLIDADRGSIAGQKVDDEGQQANRVRRSVANSLHAMRRNRVMSVGLLRELAAAMNEGDRKPFQIDVTGIVTSQRATRAWFNRTFPKESGTRPYSKNKKANGSEDETGAKTLLFEHGEGETLTVVDDPAAPTEAPGETDTQALQRLKREFEHQISALADAISDIPDDLEQIKERANAAGLEHAYDRDPAEELSTRVTRILRDLRKVPEAVLDLGP